jgi:hypothetical protein
MQIIADSRRRLQRHLLAHHTVGQNVYNSMYLTLFGIKKKLFLVLAGFKYRIVVSLKVRFL